MFSQDWPKALKEFLLRSPLGIVVLALVTVVTFRSLGLFDNLDRAFFDARSQAWSKTHSPPPDGVIVLIDEYSLGAASSNGLTRANWPWDRELFAALVAALHAGGAKRIVLDFEFKEPRDAESDDLLAAWLLACPEAVLGGSSGGPVFWQDRERFAGVETWPRFGHVRYPADGDGVVRSYWASGSLAARALGREFAMKRGQFEAGGSATWLRWHGGLEQLRRSVDLMPAYGFVVAGMPILDELQRRKDSYTPEGVARALKETPVQTLIPTAALSLLERVRNKVVFVGANAAGTFDVKAFPGSPREPGVLAHYTAWANLVGGHRLVSVPVATRWCVDLLAPVAVILLGWRFRRLPAQAATAGILLAGLWLGSMLAFDLGYYFPPATATAGAVLGLLGVIGLSFWSEEARRREIQQWFGSYVSVEVVESLVRNPDSIRLGGERKELTVYFSDLAGFTDMSEKLEPEELLRLVNHYLGELSPCILRNGGYLDKYIGDAIMGVFGTPTPLPNHAEAACQAALDSRVQLAQLNESIRAQTGLSLYARIGINSGPMVVGNLGSEQKRNYTVIGDAVNLASRLEGANKEFGTTILLGEQTEAHIRGLFVTRPVARLRVKGKLQPIQTHELLDRFGKLPVADAEFVRVYTAGYEAFLGRDFAAAQAWLQQARSLRPDDVLAGLYLDKARELEKDPPSTGWDGVIKLTSK